MTEKQYGGATGRGAGEKSLKTGSTASKIQHSKKSSFSDSHKEDSSKEEYDNCIKAGKIASEVVKYAKSMIKPGMSMLKIAEEIESKIAELKGKPAFPVNLSINEIAAHSTPSYNDVSLSSGLLKVDIGVHIDGSIADTAFSIDLDKTEENKKLIESAELALKKATEKINLGVQLREIGKSIEDSIKSFGFQPIQNLSGHSIEQYEIHSGVTIPNFDNSQETPIEPGVYAIEPFSTPGLGSVKEGKPSGIYHLEREGNVRDSFAREVLEFIAEEYQTLPFCSRWLVKKFGSRAIIALKRIEEAGLLHHYPQLIEKSGKKVAQAEHTILLSKEEKIVTTI